MGNYRSGDPSVGVRMKGKAGRPKGSKDKVTSTMKKDMICVYKTMGGKKGLKSWADDHKSEFYYQLIKATIPKESEVKVEGNFIVSWSEDDTKIKGPI